MLAGSRRNLVSAGSARHGGSRRPAPVVDDDDADLELPPYQEPRLALTEKHEQLLKELASSPLNVALDKHVDQSTKLLAATVFAINERAMNRKEAVERAIKRRRGNNDNVELDNDAEIEKVRAAADEMKNVVDPLTVKVERAMRDILDLQAALQDETDFMKKLPSRVSVAQDNNKKQLLEARANEPADEDDGPPEIPGVPIHNIIEQGRKENAQAHDELSVSQKYTKNNAYIGFKQSWHLGLNPGLDIPVPDPKTWFDRDGNPQHQAGADEEDSDDDIQIAKEKKSFRCPLSLATLTEPYTSKLCNHTFQKDAIYAYLELVTSDDRGRRKSHKCPETGCNVQSMTKNDLFFDEPLLRRIKRAEQLAERERDRESDGEEEESREDDTVEAPVKPEVDQEADDIEEDDD